ncbi:MAG: hypothetical protein EA416_01325 [Trueperaceae bacterium]|nr:MAG: hypothetical protein EA416_01325 [Trueperaceae bacterium]
MDHALLVTHSLTSAAFFWTVVLAAHAANRTDPAASPGGPSLLPRAVGLYRRLAVTSLATATLLYLGMRAYLTALPDPASANTALGALGMLASQTLILASLTLLLLAALARRRSTGGTTGPNPTALALRRQGLRAFVVAAVVAVVLFVAALLTIGASPGGTWAFLPVRLVFTIALLVGGAWVLRAHARALARGARAG